jgi:DNA gyrase subunit A
MAKEMFEFKPKNKKMEHRVKRWEDSQKIVTMNVGDYIEEKSIEYGINRNIGRDIPHMSDGLTPVERRMIYTMFHSGLGPNAKREKVATIIGATIELVYPHGDGPLNQTNARIGRYWNMMIPYVDGEGNFGDMYTKKEASMRYRKARLSEYAWDCFFSETDKKNYNFDVRDNYNFSDVEPISLPTKYPNILLQWNTGIGIGISSTIAAFNTKELLEAAIKLIDDPYAKVDIYPDTPLPLFITNKKELKGCFDRNSFNVNTVAPYEVVIEKKASGEEMIYIVFKSVSITASVSSIESTIKNIKEEDEKNAIKKLKEVKDIKIDVSVGKTTKKLQSPEDSKKLDFYIQIEKGYDPHMVAEKIIAMTQFGTTIAAAYNVVKDGALILATPRSILLEWIDSRISQKERILQQQLANLYYDILVAEGMLKVHSVKDGVDRLVKIVRFHKGANGKATRKELVEELIKVFSLKPKQAEYILNSNIVSLSSLSVQELGDKYDKLKKRYDEIRDVCNDEDIKDVIKAELQEGIKKYGAPRNATFMNIIERKAEDLYMVYSDKGYYCVSDLSVKMDVNKNFSVAKFSTDDHVIIFYKNGTVVTTAGTQIKESVVDNNAVFITENRNIGFTSSNDISHVCIENKKNKFIIIATANGYIKMIEYKDIVKKSSTSIIKLEVGDGKTPDDYVSAIKVVSSVADTIIGFNINDQMFYCTSDRIPLQKKGSAGTKIFKKVDGVISSISIIDKTDEYIMMYGESGYVKVIDAKFISVSPKNDNYISMMGKAIKGVVGFKNKSKIALYELSGETEIQISVEKDGIHLHTEAGSTKVPLSSTIASPHKLFKKSKNEMYEIYNK